MANHKDAAKRATQSIKRRARNRAYRTRMRNSIADLRTKLTTGGGDGEGVESTLRNAISVIQRLASKGVIHRNQAARRVARLTTAAAKARTAAAAAEAAPAKAPKKPAAKKGSAKKK